MTRIVRAHAPGKIIDLASGAPYHEKDLLFEPPCHLPTPLQPNPWPSHHATVARERAATLRFWGVRGSTPTVDKATWRYGGNTACVELTTPTGARIILDCGTGLRMLGRHLDATEDPGRLEPHIFVTHYHWDHIQGIPFFSPLYAEHNRFHFYSFRSEYLGEGSLKRVFEAQMAYPYFPVDLKAMCAKREFTEVGGGDQICVPGARVTARWLHHPQGCLGFRFETSAGTIVYATDNEPGNPKLDKSLLELAEGADIFINDAQFQSRVAGHYAQGLGPPPHGWRE